MKRTLLAIFLSTIIAPGVTQALSTPPAEDTSVAAVVAEAARSAEVSQTGDAEDPMTEVDNALREYLRRQGAPEDGGPATLGGVNVEFAWYSAAAAVPPGSAGFTDARSLAFEKAFQNALGKLALSRSARITTRVINDLYHDTTNAAEFIDACKPSSSEALLMKVSQLASASVNKALQSLDVPDEDILYEKPQFTCENPQLTDAITTSTRTTALASMAGVRIVKSVAIGDIVGVVVARSPNFVASAQTMVRGEIARNPNPEVTNEIKAIIEPASPEQFLVEYGTRVAKLSNGETAIFAFGHAGTDVSTGDLTAIRSAKRRAAQSSAMRHAESQLAQFGRVCTYFVSEDRMHSNVAQTMVIAGETASQEQEASVGRQLMEQIRSSASLTLSGASVVKRWSQVDPASGDLVEGVVLAWSPSMAAASANINRPPGARPVPSANGQPIQRLESKEHPEDW